jgi:hypothetical protein
MRRNIGSAIDLSVKVLFVSSDFFTGHGKGPEPSDRPAQESTKEGIKTLRDLIQV